MKRRHKINNTRFSIRLCNVANMYGFKTVGVMLNTLSKARPDSKWCYGTSHVRGARLINELKTYLT